MKWEEGLFAEYERVRNHQMEELKGLGKRKQVKKNTVIEINRHEQIILINSGRVKVSFISEKGHEKILYILSRGDLIGEIDFYAVESQDYVIKTLANTEVSMIARAEFEDRMRGNTALYESLIKSVIRKYQIVSTQLTDNLFLDSDGRIASILLRLGEQEGEWVEDHVEYCYLKQQEIADLLGCSRVTVSRALKKFKVQGAIDFQRSRICILDKEILNRYIIKKQEA